MPLHHFHTHCYNEIDKLASLGQFTAEEALIYGVRFTQLGDYGAAIAQVRHCLIERLNLQPTHDQVMSFLDALCGLHGAFYAAFQKLHQQPYRSIEAVRLMGYEGIAIRIFK